MTTSNSINSQTVLPLWPPYASPLEILPKYTLNILRPPPKLSLSQWADERAYIPAESNPVESGKWRTDRAEYLRGIMDAFTTEESHELIIMRNGKREVITVEERIDEMSIMKSSRSGVTAGLLTNGIGYHIDVDPTLIMVLLPNKDLALKYSKKQLEPFVRDTPALNGKILPPRVKGSQTTILFKNFYGGNLQIVWASSKYAVRQETVRIFFADDVDAFQAEVGAESDPLSRGQRRTATVHNRKLVAISSPTITGISRIEQAYIDSDQRHYYVPCPHCKHFQVLVFGKNSVFAKSTNGGLIGGLVHGYVDTATGEIHTGLKFDSENCTWAVYICENCGKEITETQKREYMIPNGEWRAVNYSEAVATKCGIHIWEAYSSFNTTFTKVAQAFLESQKKASLQTCINEVFGETYDHDAYTFSSHALMERIEPYETVPAAAYLLTMGVDVQGDRLEYVVRAWGPDNESWLIDYDVLRGSPYDKKTWQDFGEVHQKLSYRHASGLMVRPRVTFVDSSAFSNEVYAFTAPRNQQGIFAIKGMRGDQKYLIQPSKHRHTVTRAILIMLGVHEASETLYKNLEVQGPPKDGEASPNYIHLNAKASLNFCLQLTAMKRVYKYNRKGERQTIWHQLRPDNHVHDMFNYSYCAKEFLKLHLPRIEREFRKKVDEHKKSGDKPPVKIIDMKTGEFVSPQPKSRIIKKGTYWKQ